MPVQSQDVAVYDDVNCEVQDEDVVEEELEHDEYIEEEHQFALNQLYA